VVLSATKDAGITVDSPAARSTSAMQIGEVISCGSGPGQKKLTTSLMQGLLPAVMSFSSAESTSGIRRISAVPPALL